MTLNNQKCVLAMEKIYRLSLDSKKFMYILLIISLMNALIKPCNSFQAKMRKFSQINYRDQFEQCQKEYENMYILLNSKVKDYADNEVRLLNNVRDTILTTYDKSEKSNNMIEVKLKQCNERENELKDAADEKIKFYKKLNEKIKKEVEELMFEMQNLSKGYNRCKIDLDNSIQEKSTTENEKQKILTEYKNYKANIEASNSKIKTRLRECYDKVNNVEKRKNEELKENKIDYGLIDSQIKNLEKAIDKTKIEGKNTLNNQLTREQKIKENLVLIDDKIKNVIDMLPGLGKYDTYKVKKELNELDSKKINQLELKQENSQKEQSLLSKNQINDNFDNTSESYVGDLSNNKENVFLETKSKSFTKSNQIRLIKSSKGFSKYKNEENVIQNKIKLLMFENIDDSRLIYKKVQLFGQLVLDAVQQNKICQNKLEELNKENVELKTALAVTEVRCRLKNV